MTVIIRLKKSFVWLEIILLLYIIIQCTMTSEIIDDIFNALEITIKLLLKELSIILINEELTYIIIKIKEPQGVRGKAVFLLLVVEETKERALLSNFVE